MPTPPRGPLNSVLPLVSNIVGGVYNATNPAPNDQQPCALQLDANGNLKVVQEAGGVASIVQIEDSSGNPLNSNGAGALQVAVVSGGGSNASVGTNGAAAPASSTQVGASDGVNLQPLQVDASKNLKTIINAALPAGANVIGHVIADTGSTTAVTGNVTVVQPTGTNLHAVIDSGSTTAVTGNVTVVQGTGTNLHAVIDSGTLTTVSAVTAITNALPAGSNVIGHVIADSGSTTAVTGTVTVAGNKTNNNAAPGATNLGVLPAIANAATQTWTEGDQVLESVDLSGRQRIRGTLTNNNAAPDADGHMVLGALANAAAPTWTEGDLVLLSEDLSGRLRVLTTPAAGAVNTVTGNLTNNNAAPAATNLGVLPALANAASPAWTEGDQVLLSENLTGQLRTTGGGIAQASTTSGQLGALVQGAVTTGAPTYTTAQTNPLSLDTAGNLRVILASTAGTIGTAGVRSTAVASALVDNQANEVFFTSSAGIVDPLGVGDWVYGGAFSGAADAARSGWSKMRSSTVFRTVSATASGNTAIWTPGAGNKFRLLKLFIQITDNASLAAGAVLTIDIQDSVTSTNITFSVFVPTTAVTTVIGDGAEIQLDLGAFGILSAAANNVLNVNLSAALATGVCRIIAQGTEE